MYQAGSLSRYMLSQGVRMISSLHCPGSYCGRIRLGDSGNFSACGACPRGFRVEVSVCEECSSSPNVYDWLYLGFVVLLGLDVQWWIIDRSRRILGHRAFTLQLCSLLENVLSALLSLTSFAPWGSLQLVTCKVDKLSDWYTLLHNPSPYYKQTLHCSQEAVYPLLFVPVPCHDRLGGIDCVPPCRTSTPVGYCSPAAVSRATKLTNHFIALACACVWPSCCNRPRAQAGRVLDAASCTTADIVLYIHSSFHGSGKTKYVLNKLG
ncbi:JNK1/MAPK8-associated membrane protein-like isoform X2 [Varroa jacobsoni]|uniref:Uncharacterized protein n=1 Tax=Varroa destructor TaxID=109461 RepID=A0A7M7K979_VARDE|nr:JNK1/MAPK8-associated membrane protein-like isoform X3 [Varroa destructor]XP_022709780.1 JNK1/MAPK8-associated membrane protein-like isoform X2 [Varroa jacobsoni]